MNENNKTNKKIRNFYENYYSKKNNGNPAFVLYDAIRVNKIRKSILNKQNEKILIIGCGSKKDQEFIANKNKSFGLDISYNAIKSIQDKRQFFVADGMFIPIRDNYFETIIISEVIEHIQNYSQVYSEINRVIMKNGKVIITTPNWMSWFGIFRWLAEFVTRKAVTSDNQPYDDWKTIKKIRNELPPNFKITKTSGIWYLPPLHFRNKGLSKPFVTILYALFRPFESLFSKFLPNFGHLLFIECEIIK